MDRNQIVKTVFTLGPAAILVVSGGAKLLSEAPSDEFEEWGYPRWWATMTGAVELGTAALLANPSTSLVGGGLATGILAGAFATHVQHREYKGAVFPAVLAAVAGYGAWRRRARSLPLHEPAASEGDAILEEQPLSPT